MALFIPEVLSERATTSGERKVFGLLKKVMTNPRVIVRYEVLLGEREFRPDFMVMDPERGVVIIEVKDWSLDRVEKANPETFWVRGMRGNPYPTTLMNPARKCEIYLRWAKEQLVGLPELRDHSGRLAVPVYPMLVFPNIQRNEFVVHEMDKIIPIESVVFGADLHHSGYLLLERYKAIAPNALTQLTDFQMEKISEALLPDICVRHVTIPGFSRNEQKMIDIESDALGSYMLNGEQEQLAKGIGEGPRLLRGIAGTGKTLIMLYRAKLIAANNEQQDKKERVLVLCWNKSLANYMGQVYNKLQIKAPDGAVQIESFIRFIYKFAKGKGISLPSIIEDEDKFTESLTRLWITEVDKYDTIYIDEAQDFRKEWISFLFHNLLKGDKPEERNLLIAADDAQRIYRNRDFRWSDLGIPMQGRSKILKTIYRNSARVWCFAAFLLRERSNYLQEDKDRVRFSPKPAYDPQLIACPSIAMQIETAINVIKEMLKYGYAARNVLILYHSRTYNGFLLAENLTKSLSKARIEFDWITEDDSAKESFDWSANTVKISTVHSAKGMDSPVVIILGAEIFGANRAYRDSDDLNLMYVALTRARESLIILHTGNGGLVPQLKECQEQYNKNLPDIVRLFEPAQKVSS